MYKTKLINLIIADALQIDSKPDLEDFAASLLVQGGKPLTSMSVRALEQEAYDRWNYTFDVTQSELFANSNKAFKAWVMDKQIKEFYTGW